MCAYMNFQIDPKTNQNSLKEDTVLLSWYLFTIGGLKVVSQRESGDYLSGVEV